jgi:hypothetical protein
MFYLFATAIIIGATMAVVRLKTKPIPALSLVVLHGLFAVTGLIWMFVVVIDKTNRTNHVTGPLVLFCIVAVLGLIMLLGYHIKGRPLPIPTMLIHGILALAAFIWLLA